MKNIIYIFLIISIFSCKEEKKETEETATNENVVTLTEAQLKNINLSFGKLELSSISSTIKVNGKIDVPPQGVVSISAPLGGYVKSTQLIPGMYVRKGQILAVIEDPQYIQLQQDYLLTKAKIVYAQQEYNRQKALNKSKASSDKVLQQAASELNILNITLSGLSEKLKMLGKNTGSISQRNFSSRVNIYSPTNGYVSKVNTNVGKYVSPTDELFEIINMSNIYLALQVFEKDIDKLSIGQNVKAFTNNNPSKKYPCEIILIGKNFNADQSIDVHCHFKVQDNILIPETYMNAEIEVPLGQSFVLPEEAVVRFENKQFVFIQKSKNTFEMKEIQTGNTENGRVEITKTSNITNENIVIKGAYTLLMSLKNTSEE